MTHIQKVQALMALCPGAKWTLNDDILIWNDTEQIQPTDQEISNYISMNFYKEQREKEYPDPTYLFDALVHKENGDSTQYNDYVAKCNAVKAKYPKSQ